jgi:hypothetical protein
VFDITLPIRKDFAEADSIAMISPTKPCDS